MSVVPAGFVFNPNVTVSDVLYVTKPTTLGAADNVHVEAVTLAVGVDPFVSKFPACKPYDLFVDKPTSVSVVSLPEIFPMDDNVTLKSPLAPVETMICVPSGFPLDPIAIDALVVYTLNLFTTIAFVNVVVVATVLTDEAIAA